MNAETGVGTADEAREQAGGDAGGCVGGDAGGSAGGIAGADGAGGGIADEGEAGEVGEVGEAGEGVAGVAGTGEDDWELDAGGDFPIPEDNLKSFSRACRGAGLSREQAERILDWHKARYRESQDLAAQEEERALNGWRAEILADRDFGGSRYKATVADARRALAAFDPDGKLRAFLRESRWQFNPDVIRVAARVGRAMGEHGFAGQNGAGGRQKPLEERMYPNMSF